MLLFTINPSLCQVVRLARNCFYEIEAIGAGWIPMGVAYHGVEIRAGNDGDRDRGRDPSTGKRYELIRRWKRDGFRC